MGLKATHIGGSSRRDRLLLLGAMAHALLILLGDAGERAGMDRMLKVNTSKKRQHSLYNQGSFWYDALPNMPTDRLATLMAAYEETIREHEFFSEILASYEGMPRMRDGSVRAELVDHLSFPTRAAAMRSSRTASMRSTPSSDATRRSATSTPLSTNYVSLFS